MIYRKNSEKIEVLINFNSPDSWNWGKVLLKPTIQASIANKNKVHWWDCPTWYWLFSEELNLKKIAEKVSKEDGTRFLNK